MRCSAGRRGVGGRPGPGGGAGLDGRLAVQDLLDQCLGVGDALLDADVDDRTAGETVGLDVLVGGDDD
jgi:hypothetical protein